MAALTSARTATSESASATTAASHRHAELSVVRRSRRSHTVPNARVRARDRLVADTSTIRVPMTPKADQLPPPTACSRALRESLGRLIVSAIVWVSREEVQEANRIRIGSTEVKNWAAIVIDRSKMPIRMLIAALRIAILPGHWASIQARRCWNRGGSRCRTRSARARASSSPVTSAGRSVMARDRTLAGRARDHASWVRFSDQRSSMLPKRHTAKAITHEARKSATMA